MSSNVQAFSWWSMKFTAVNAAEKLKSRKDEGNDFQGYIDLPINYNEE